MQDRVAAVTGTGFLDELGEHGRVADHGRQAIFAVGLCNIEGWLDQQDWRRILMDEKSRGV